MRKFIKTIEFVLFFSIFLIGCISLGGKSAVIKPETVAKLKVAQKAAQEQIDKAQTQIEANNSKIITMKTNISNATTIQETLQTQISNLTTINETHNESIKSLMWTAFWIWFGINASKFISLLIAAKLDEESTLKSCFVLPWKKGKK